MVEILETISLTVSLTPNSGCTINVNILMWNGHARLSPHFPCIIPCNIPLQVSAIIPPFTGDTPP
eukprot:6218979-Ditylum_brightwellii.AAC.1